MLVCPAFALMAWRYRMPTELLWAYAVISVVTFLAYAWDKAAAQRGAWRTREGSLHALALCGGWPGALLAQGLLRHKSRKPAFQWAFWCTVLLNGAVLAWRLHATGH